MTTTEKKMAGRIPASEFAQRVGVTSATILNWFEAGELSGWQNPVNRYVYIDESEVARILKEGSPLR